MSILSPKPKTEEEIKAKEKKEAAKKEKERILAAAKKSSSLRSRPSRSIGTEARKTPVDPMMKQTNKKKLMLKVMNEFRDKDTVVGPRPGQENASASWQVESDGGQEIQIQLPEGRYLQTQHQNPATMPHSQSPIQIRGPSNISPYTATNA